MSSFWSTRVVPNSRHEEPRIGLGKREKAREIQEDDLKITRDRTLGRGLMDDKCWVQKEGDLKRTDLHVSPDWQPPKATHEPQANDSVKVSSAINSDRADTSD
ncbi:hypothetical protein H634G_10744 [Metarhizium anisopliae BRIP 53293]|uniref:Uncharacterized protein n=1 Tax=Metarhizium anisopliae BRIP 53293 TaxID=1291518 RepID=A0A0D9NMW7_METAN|nr:hypothetical protein H634G_10744 [Metarhizium anisopliae BRIP 53293]